MTKFDFDDILIEPAVVTNIDSRSTINPHDKSGYLPLITAPMDTVIDETNENIFADSHIRTCLPRGERSSNSGFQSYSLREVNEMLESKTLPNVVLIDMANGHMQSMVETTRAIKEEYNNSVSLMVGNVAHPETYKMLSEAGADYIRIGIGNGGGCLTTQQTGIGYPMASLIRECYEISCTLDTPAKIVADGGMKDYSDVIKALALGADYVMMGSIFNKALESCGETYEANKKYDSWTEPGERVDQYSKATSGAFRNGVGFYKKFRGMSTKEVQLKWGKDKIQTSEGITKMQKVEYTLPQWTENFKHYLRSAMSYTNASTLSEFIGKTKYNMISDNALKRFSK